MSYQEERLQEIADAIREVKGTTEKIPATNFASEIAGLSVVKPSGIKTITENGTHDVKDYAFADVLVQPNLITKEATENGTYNASDDGADGYSSVTVNVAGSGGGSGGGDTTPKIYGVSWTNDASTTMTRTDDAVGMSYSITDGRVTSDFDKVFPYNQMKRTVIDGNTFVFVPAMWFRVIADADKKITSIAVSSVKGEGDDWYPTRPFYYGAYGASSDGTVLKSVSGVQRLGNITIADARTRAMAIGTGYHQKDLYTNTILMFLWWIEFATKNSSTVMRGASGYKLDVNTGGTDSFYNENNCVSGFDTLNQQMVWHGIEDYFGNTQEWEDGLFRYKTSNTPETCYVSSDYLTYQSNLNNIKMSKLSYIIAEGCITGYGWDNSNPFLCVPISTRVDNVFTTGFCDRSSPTGNCAVVGSYYAPYDQYGVGYLGFETDSYVYAGIGCRLVLRV